MKNHEVRYNCTIIDLHDRSVIASITDRHITSDLAIRTLQKALDSQPAMKYNNAPMKRYFNTLKNECINLYDYETEDALYQAVEDFSYVEYNYVRPHSFNGNATPHEARVSA